MELADLLKEQHILLDLAAESKTDCIQKLASVMVETNVVKDLEVYKETVLKREEEGTTGVGFGVAIPHGKSSGVAFPGLAFAKLTNPIDWDSLDGEPVSHVFLIAVPEEQAGNAHLQILSTLSRKLIHEEFRNQLTEAKTISDIFNILN